MATAIWKGQLTFGLVSFPVRLLRAARKERTALKYVREVKYRPAEEDIPQGHPATRDSVPAAKVQEVQRTFSAGNTRDPVPAEELQRGYEVAPGKMVVVHTEELQKLRQATSPDMQILRSVRMEEIDPLFFEASYYVIPGSGGEHSYSLFFKALSETGYATLAQIAMHGREHVLVVRSGQKGLIAHTMYYVNEVRGADEYSTDLKGIAGKELELAKRFVEAIAEPFSPEAFTDKYREKLQALIQSKGLPAATIPGAPPQAAGKVVDIMDALRKSLAAAESTSRKPAAAAVKPEKKSRKHTA